jgi:hypothetical protein
MTMDLEALRAEVLCTAKVRNGEREFQVQGLPLNAVLDICRRHWDSVSGLFDKLMSQSEDGQAFTLEQANWLGSAVLTSIPEVAAEIIAVCAGWGVEAGVVAKDLPGPVQLDALDKIAGLTFTSEMPPKKVIETVVRMLGGVSQTLIGEPA